MAFRSIPGGGGGGGFGLKERRDLFSVTNVVSRQAISFLFTSMVNTVLHTKIQVWVPLTHTKTYMQVPYSGPQLPAAQWAGGVISISTPPGGPGARRGKLQTSTHPWKRASLYKSSMMHENEPAGDVYSPRLLCIFVEFIASTWNRYPGIITLHKTTLFFTFREKGRLSLIFRNFYRLKLSSSSSRTSKNEVPSRFTMCHKWICAS